MKRARALSLLAAAALPAVPRPARAQLAPIRLAVSTNDSYAEPYYAADAGFFTRAGLDVQLTNFATSAEIRTAVLANAIDVGQTDVTPIANAVSHGIPLAFFAGAAKYAKAAPTTLLCVGKQRHDPYRKGFGRPDRRHDFVLYGAASWCNAHHDDTAQTLAKYAKIDLARISGTTRSTFATSLSPADLQPVIDASVRYGALDTTVPAAAMLVRP